jgi:gliding motility-associated-like protein
MLKLILPLAIALPCVTALAQVPFVCKGDYFLVAAPSGSSTLFQVEINQSGGVEFDAITAGTVGFILNSIGYRSKDNFIYGIDDNTEQLYLVDAEGEAFWLADLNIDKTLFYPAGDVSPDGRYLVLIGGNQSGSNSSLMIKVDLESPAYDAQVINMPANNSIIYDLAFDPTDGTLYGYDSNQNGLVKIDYNTGAVSTPFPLGMPATTVGAIFFDAFGELYAYGRPPNGNTQTTLFEVDKETGDVTAVATGPAASRTDGCSCPYTIELKKRVSPLVAVPCTEAVYTFEFANATAIAQMGLTFEDVFPAPFTITQIENPFSGEISGGIGTNWLKISNMSIPLGTHRLRVTVEIEPGAIGMYRNQAILRGLSESLGGQVLSDNPLTIVPEDSTNIEIVPLEVDFSEVRKSICSGDDIELSPSIAGVHYLWSDGSTEETFTITSGGTYSVTVTSGCDTLIETLIIEEEAPTVELPEVIEMDLGESARLLPLGIGVPPLRWEWSGDESSMSCTVCKIPVVSPLFDTTYYLKLTDAGECPVYDSVRVLVHKNRNVFVPNVFSPNADGINDTFMPNSPQAKALLGFKIFSRWGELVFEGYDLPPNDGIFGWNGDIEGKPANPGVYVWQLELEFLDGFTTRLSGDVCLLR